MSSACLPFRGTDVTSRVCDTIMSTGDATQWCGTHNGYVVVYIGCNCHDVHAELTRRGFKTKLFKRTDGILCVEMHVYHKRPSLASEFT